HRSVLRAWRSSSSICSLIIGGRPCQGFTCSVGPSLGRVPATAIQVVRHKLYRHVVLGSELLHLFAPYAKKCHVAFAVNCCERAESSHRLWVEGRECSLAHDP